MSAPAMKAIEWANKVLKEKGYLIVAQPQVVRSMPWSTVMSFSTSQGTVYFKSMAKNFAYEGALLAFLNQLNIDSLPSVIAINSEEHCFLMNDAGLVLRHILKENYDVALSRLVLQAYAKLQIECIPMATSLISIGAMDCRLRFLPKLYEKFFSNDEFLLSEGLSSDEIEQLKNLSTLFAKLCQELADFGIPETLEHGDFHDNNVLIKDGKITINDFGDAIISHPFFSVASFLNSGERHHHLNPLGEKYIALRSQYLRAWDAYATSDKLIKAFHLAYRIRPFVWALSFVRVKSCDGIENYPEYKDYLAESLRTLINNMLEYEHE